MTRKNKKERERLRKHVAWCSSVALEHFLHGNADECNKWTAYAAETQDKILLMYPRYRKALKRAKVVYVPVHAKEV